MNEDRIKSILKTSFPPVGESELDRDLWPAMLRRMAQPSRIRFGWFDWVIAGAIAASLVLFPHLLPGVAYYL